MITGSVNAQREAIIRIEIQDADGNCHFSNATIDTGFNRFMCLPVSLLGALGLHKLGEEPVEFADGTVERVDIYGAVVAWGGATRSIVVHATGPQPLVGMELLAGHELRIQVAEGGAVTIEELR